MELAKTIPLWIINRKTVETIMWIVKYNVYYVSTPSKMEFHKTDMYIYQTLCPTDAILHSGTFPDCLCFRHVSGTVVTHARLKVGSRDSKRALSHLHAGRIEANVDNVILHLSAQIHNLCFEHATKKIGCQSSVHTCAKNDSRHSTRYKLRFDKISES